MSRLILHNDLTVNSDRKELIKSVRKLTVDILSVILILVIMYLVFPVAVAHDENMYPFLREGDILISCRFDTEYQVNDVVFFKDNEETRIGRIIAKEGDTVEITGDEKLYVNSYPQSEEVFYPTLPEEGKEINEKVPDNSYYLLNDYRKELNDSRTYGSVSKDELLGKVFLIIRRRNI